jgi:hypothetical protein
MAACSAQLICPCQASTFIRARLKVLRLGKWLSSRQSDMCILPMATNGKGTRNVPVRGEHACNHILHAASSNSVKFHGCVFKSLHVSDFGAHLVQALWQALRQALRQAQNLQEQMRHLAHLLGQEGALHLPEEVQMQVLVQELDQGAA